MNQTVAVLKRGFDIVGSCLGLTLTAPLMAGIAAAIKLCDGGPIFYRQRRAGANMNREGDATDVYEYDMYKFRTMRIDAEKDGKSVLASKNDPRVTAVGRILRKTRLDEIPNLINVLRGEMSIVGPRPERPDRIKHLVAAIPFYEERMRMVKPGVTGLAQINLDYLGHLGEDHALATVRDSLVNPFDLAYDSRESNEADDVRTKLIFDFAYAASLERVSSYMLTDVEVLLRTPLVMLLGRGR